MNAPPHSRPPHSMFHYNQYCPVAKAAELLGDRWTLLIVRDMMFGSYGFSAFQRNLPGISKSVLADRLKRLEGAGIVKRSETEGKKAVRYSFTETGEDLRPVVVALGTWGARWIMSGPSPNEGDPDLIMMYLARHLNEPNLPTERTVVEFVLQAGRSRRRYWLVLLQGGSSLCLQHPGFDSDMSIACKVADLQRVYMGHSTWAQAVKDERIKLKGAPAVKRRFPAWMLWSRFAPIIAAKEKKTPSRGA